QAEDGIRVPSVTGVQTCALPICMSGGMMGMAGGPTTAAAGGAARAAACHTHHPSAHAAGARAASARAATHAGSGLSHHAAHAHRSEECRVGKGDTGTVSRCSGIV